MRTQGHTLCACVVGLLVLSVTVAGERTHVVQPGESASAIAMHYYGDYELAEILLLYNDRRTPTIHSGESLRVPVCDVHRVRSGDTWSKLSRRYLRDAGRWRAVAELNGLVPERALQIGQEIVFPVVLKHTLKRGETLAALSERFWGDPGRARLLQQFNGLDDPRRLALGAVIDVPLLTLRPRPASQRPPSTAARRVAEPVATKKPDDRDAAMPEDRSRTRDETTPELSAPAAEPAQPVDLPPRFVRELGTAEHAFRLGEYEKAQALLEALRGAVEARGTDADRREFWRQLGFVHVAFDRRDEACSAFAVMAGFGGPPELDPVRTSPKISTALKACP